MVDEISILQPDDFHHHFRDGETLLQHVTASILKSDFSTKWYVYYCFVAHCLLFMVSVFLSSYCMCMIV